MDDVVFLEPVVDVYFWCVPVKDWFWHKNEKYQKISAFSAVKEDLQFTFSGADSAVITKRRLDELGIPKISLRMEKKWIQTRK